LIKLTWLRRAIINYKYNNKQSLINNFYKMKRFIITLFVQTFFIMSLIAQEPLDYFLPGDVQFDPDIPTPEQFFGHQVGEWHLTHDQLLNYIKEIAKVSDRAILQEYARSYENRPLVHLIFTTAENQQRLDELKEIHIKYSDPDENISQDGVPMVLYLGYGVHGNESSGPNSSVLTAYYLAAAQGPKIDKLLENSIILVDPCLNPDGFTRHSTWANMHQSATVMTSPDSRQYSEVWPGGRTNHYWFDLNRDYLLLVHPESRGRVAKFHEWKPNIYNDHHEMGADNTFFFQPGIPTRNNPLTPEENFRLTNRLATYHARFLDNISAPYFSKEQYDDYYLGKGSTYPDVNGCIGILFEQAGFRGRIRETSNGIKKLAYGIRNQFTVTLSTLEAAADMKDDLLTFQKEFYREALREAENDPVKAYMFGDENDPEKVRQFIELLKQHQIEVFKNEKEVNAEGKVFTPGSSYVVPLDQPQYKLIKGVFDVITTFEDSTFYDVSTWTIPFAYNIPYSGLQSSKDIQYSDEDVNTQKTEGTVIGGKSSVAYLLKWNGLLSPKALFSLQNAGILTKVATKEFISRIAGKNEDFTYGTILIPVDGQKSDEDEIFRLISETAKNTGTDFYSVETGFSAGGTDLGSGAFITLEKPEVLMLAGRGAGSGDAGEIWHMFDQRFQIPVCLAETDNIGSIDLNRYNTLILPGGSFSNLGTSGTEKIKTWAEQGGTIIAVKSAASWASRNGLGKTKFKKGVPADSTLNFDYADRSKEQSINAIGGAIFNAEMDITYPLCYGYSRKEIPVFKTGNSVAESLNIKYSEPVKFTAEPYLSGFVSYKNLERIKDAPVVSVQSAGRGRLITFHESMTFRGYWLGTNKMFMNGVFFGKLVR
jgi:hypothetical protein